MFEFFLKPKSIILFGISRHEGKSGRFVLSNMKSYKPNILFIIHPTASEIDGIPCKPNFEEIPIEIRYNFDLAIISLPVEFVKEAVIKCIQHGVRGILIQSGNIGNSLEEIEQATREINDALNKYQTKENQKTRIMGPNSLGVFVNHSESHFFFTGIMVFDGKPIFHTNKNNLAIVAQTGLVLSGYFVDLYEARNVGISKIFALGNKFDINESDALESLIEDPDTSAIAMYLESIKEGRRFFELCKKAIYIHNKKIIILVSGRSELGKKAIVSHTNSLATNSILIDGICKQLGIIQVNDFPELLLAGRIAANIPIPRGNRIGLISISGAGCVTSVDFAERFAFQVPKITPEIKNELKKIFPEWAEINHPVDMWASIEQVGTKAYNYVIELFLKSNLFDIIIFSSIAGKRAVLEYENLRKIIKENPHIPIILQIYGGHSELKKQMSDQFEQPNIHKIYLPVVYNLESTMNILSKLVHLSHLRSKFQELSD